VLKLKCEFGITDVYLSPNPRLISAEIGRAIGRSWQAVDIYIADL